jgi:hypothetical protein
MKQLALILIPLLLLACGGDDSEVVNGEKKQDIETHCTGSPFVGEWRKRGGEKMVINQNCTGSSKQCQSEFAISDHSKNNSNLGEITITVSKTNTRWRCPAMGEHNCEYYFGEDENGPFLDLNCGFGTITYGLQSQL